MKTIKAVKRGYLLSSAAFCAAGIFLLFYPEISALALCHLTGGLLILFGVMKLWGYWSKDLYRLAFQFDLAFGLLSLVVGLLMVIHPADVIQLLYFAIGIVALADGLFKLQTALDAKRFGIEKWWLIGAAALLTSLFGLLLMLHPFKNGTRLLSLVGLTLFVEGLLNLCVGVCTVKGRKEIKRFEEDYND